eukprot:1812459-Pyramimonas_sp.AAC.1
MKDVRSQAEQCVVLLLSAGASLQRCDKHGNTPLGLAKDAGLKVRGPRLTSQCPYRRHLDHLHPVMKKRSTRLAINATE